MTPIVFSANHNFPFVNFSAAQLTPRISANAQKKFLHNNKQINTNFVGATINNIAHYIVQLQIENGTEQVGMDPAKLCRRCLGLEKELAECHVLAKVVECKLEAEIQENAQFQTQVGEL